MHLFFDWKFFVGWATSTGTRIAETLIFSLTCGGGRLGKGFGVLI
jgi:hypothetical protein